MAASDEFYNELIGEVATALSELGTTFNVKAEGVYDPQTLTTSEGIERTVTGIVADQEQTYSLSSGVGEPSKSWISGKNLLLSADSHPKPKEEVYVDGKWFSLGNVKPIKPADVVVLYILDISL